MALIFNPIYDVVLDDAGRDEEGVGTAYLTVYNWDAEGNRCTMREGYTLKYGPTDTALRVAQEAAPGAFIDEDPLLH